MPRDCYDDDQADDEFLDDEVDDDSDDTSLDTFACPNCGADVYEDAIRCPQCGEYITEEQGAATGDWPLWVVLLGITVVVVTAAALGVFLLG